jgi:hypothetical protein
MRMIDRGGTDKRCRTLAAGLGVLVALALPSATATAAVPFVDIGAPAGPLTSVAVGNELSCQFRHTGDSTGEMFPPGSTPGSCGTFLAVGGTLFAPDFANHDGSSFTGSLGSYTPFSAVSQTGKTGSGTTSNPFKVVTTATAGSTGLAIQQTDTYVIGQESARTDVVVGNTSGAPQTIILYRAGDCYLQESDQGFGFAGGNNAVGCSANPNNSPAGRIEEWLPITGGNAFLEAVYSDVWAAIGTKTMFPNQCQQCTVRVDNGAGISWQATIAPGGQATFSHYTTFSPTGRSGPPPPPATSGDLEQARSPRCLSVPSVVRNRVGRTPGGSVTLRTRQVDNPAFPLKLSIALSGRLAIASITWQVNGRTLPGVTPTTRSFSVPVSSLRIGSRFRNTVRATVVLTNGRVIQLTQRMVILRCSVPATTCKRLGNGTRMQCRSRTPLSGRRVGVTVTKSSTETAKGSTTVRRGRYTVIVRSATALTAGVFAYKHVVRTNRRGERFQMIRLVTVT